MNMRWMRPAAMALALMAPAPWGAAQTTNAPPPASRQANKGAQSQAAKLAAKYNVPTAEIESLRGQGLGWGEIGHALGIAQRAGVPVSDVLKLRQSGMGWGQIAQNYGFKLGETTGKGGRTGRDDSRPVRTDRTPSRPDGHAGRGGPRR